MAEILNLGRARKARARAEAETRAAENRARHGRTTAERLRDVREDAQARRAVDQARLEDGGDVS